MEQKYRKDKKSLWAIQAVINELSPKQRFRRENVLLLGLWYGKGTIKMSAFLKPFKDEMKALKEEGGVTRVGPSGELIKCPIFGIMCTLDAIAKCKVQELHQFNGAFGCGFCFHPNLPVEGSGLRYVAVQSDGSFLQYPERTHEKMIEDGLLAFELNAAGKLVVSKLKITLMECWVCQY